MFEESYSCRVIDVSQVQCTESWEYITVITASVQDAMMKRTYVSHVYIHISMVDIHIILWSDCEIADT